MVDGDLPYNDELTDDEPLTVAVYGPGWRSFLLGVVAMLEDLENWEPGTDKTTIQEQASDLRARLMGAGAMAVIPYPYQIEWSGASFYWTTAGGVIFVGSAGIYNGGVWVTVTAINNEKLFEIRAVLGRDVYDLGLIFAGGANRAIVRWSLNGTELNPGDDIDMYRAANTPDIIDEVGIRTLVPGLNVISLYTKDKNASSTGYHANIQGVYLRRHV